MRCSQIVALVFVCGSATAQPLYGIMFRTGSQTSGANPKLYDVNPQTGAATSPRNVNVNSCVGIAVSPSGVMYGLTDQFGRINNVSGSGGKGLLFTIDPVTGQATAVGRIDPTSSASDAPLAIYEGDLAFHPTTGVLWGVTTDVTFARLFTVNTTTGLGTIVVDIRPPAGIAQFDISAMAFSAAGDLWVLDTTYPSAPGPARLYRVNPTNGAILERFDTSATLGTCGGMAFEPGTGDLLVVDGDTGTTDSLYRFSGGDLQFVGNTGASGGIYRGLSALAFGPGASCPVCSADYNLDGGVDGADVGAFFIDWEDSAGCADVNADGGIDGGDVATFFGAWEAGGC